MHPARSVIFFTTASGAGYGMLVWLALGAAFGWLPGSQWFALVAFGLGLALVITGLLSSTFHLGHPERAWRALSQWRTSWLSREGVAAIVTFLPTGLFAFLWVIFGINSGLSLAIGLIGAACSLVTVVTTAMIYQSLRAIPAWHTPWTMAGYLALSLTTGAIIVAFLAFAWGFAAAAAMAGVALAGLAASLLIKLAYWSAIDNAQATSTAESATGLGQFGKVRLLEPPHSGTNYLMREMGFQIARKHAGRLRQIVLIGGFLVPSMLMILAILAGPGAAGIVATGVALALTTIGVAVERWLFFAQARHVVTLYYGQQAA